MQTMCGKSHTVLISFERLVSIPFAISTSFGSSRVRVYMCASHSTVYDDDDDGLPYIYTSMNMQSPIQYFRYLAIVDICRTVFVCVYFANVYLKF